MRIPWRESGRFCWQHIFPIIATVSGVAIISIGVITFRDLGANVTFEQKAAVINNVLVAAGLVSVVLLVWQLRSTSAWNRVLSYHQFFGELPSDSKIEDLSACLQRLNIAEPIAGRRLSASDARKIWDDDGGDSTAGAARKSANRITREYLNDFEQFCGAIRAGIVNENYARELQGTRTINAYFAFAEFIKLTRDEAEEAIQIERKAAAKTEDIPNVQPIRRKPYHELRIVAIAWRKRREIEYNKLQKKKKKRDKDDERDREFDGVPPGGV